MAVPHQRKQAPRRICRCGEEDQAELQREVQRKDAFLQGGELRHWEALEADFGHDKTLNGVKRCVNRMQVLRYGMLV